jgi:hypothetical protein
VAACGAGAAGRPLRDVAAELAKLGFLNECGAEFSPSSIASITNLEERSVDLLPGQGFVVPKGVMHCTRAPERSVILMVETAAIVPTGDALENLRSSEA